MKTLVTIGLFAALAVLTPQRSGADPNEPRDADVEKILQLHREVIEAHKAGDAEEILAVESDEIVRVMWGEVRFPQREERARLFEHYLQNTEFEEYRDLIDPIVRVSDDGTLGWLIAQVEIVGTQIRGDGERVRIDSVWAWIELYEKIDGRWVRVGDVASVKPRDGE